MVNVTQQAILLTDFEDYLINRSMTKRSGQTIKLYVSTIKKFLSKYNFKEPEHYHEYLVEHTVKKRSTYYYDVLKLFVNWCQRYEHLNKDERKKIDPAFIVKKKEYTPKKEPVFIDDYIQLKIIQQLKEDKHKMIAKLQYHLGIRAGDVLRLTKDSFKFIHHKIKDTKDRYKIILQIKVIGKGDKEKFCNLYDWDFIQEVVEYILLNTNEEGYLFLDFTTSRTYDFDNVYFNNYNKYLFDVKNSAKSLGYEKFATHDFRRNWAKVVWENVLDKKDIVALQKAMGHSQVDTTIRYLRQSGLENDRVLEKLSEVRK